MDDPTLEAQAGLPLGAGERLRAARTQRGLTLEQVAAQTRIPQRQLVAIESGDFAKLPGRTYAIGFTRTYARLVGLNSEEIASQVRTELDAGSLDPRHRPASFEPGDPARVPSRLLGWLSVLAVLLVLAGLFAFFRPYVTPAAELPSLLDQQRTEQQAALAASKPGGMAVTGPTGPVVFTALADKVWVKFYDGAGKQLMQKELALNESYTVPADAQSPQLWTGRPEALAITIAGRPVPKLAEVQTRMKDVPVTAQALLTRVAAPATPTLPRVVPISSPSPTT
ncbi:MAG: helix-turn-helix domain-containing protein [Croceibacterium sp.]